ncbi:MAG: hypothetical protein ACI30J_02535 [Paludibacteraceae bacterium]
MSTIKSILAKFILLLMCVLPVACDRQSPLVVSITPGFGFEQREGIYYAAAHTNVFLNLYTESKDTELKRLTIKSSDLQFGVRTVLDTIYTTPLRRIKEELSYSIPLYTDTTLVKLSAQVTDITGETMGYDVRFYAVPNVLEHITETAFVKLYSVASKGKSVFSFNTLSTRYPEESNDSLSMYDMPNPDSTSTQLSRVWMSDNGVLFAKGGNFDYGNATATTIQRTWQSSIKSSSVSNLQEGDIILLGQQDDAFGVIILINVHDADNSVTDDYYLFSAKTFGKQK